ncbi:M12 family metallopeptidase [Maricaulis sp.]|jgi:astacin (peptidase family M12A)|uniref:M12 family metallopeptidase n=1 Tax=Maricaulis sp. TaxID=1486257 RepID=UPI0025F0809B|nr:M12 family metallopeptidase [Maricaulis sp.]MDF1769892.1 M12 family metallopeptidase [Maricaulis sp.]
MTTASACGLSGAHRVKWRNGSTLRYHLYKRPSARAAKALDREVFDQALAMWMAGGSGLELVPVDNPAQAEIRVMFSRSRGRWSMLGAEALDITNSKEPTMNFDSRLDHGSGLLAALHEIGHMLGFRHEHQTPNTPLLWHESAVIDHYRAASGWSEAYTRRNVISRHDMARKSLHPWDRKSIMHYGLAAGLIAAPSDWQDRAVPAPAGLSDGDRAEFLAWYPPL